MTPGSRCGLASVTQLYAFYYTPNPPFNVNDGWSLYSPRDEFVRMGVGSRTKAWRFTDINKEYSVGSPRFFSSESGLDRVPQLCPTYPARLVVPTKISDSTLQYAAKYRSKGRIPALAYLHWANYVSHDLSQAPVYISRACFVREVSLVAVSHWSVSAKIARSKMRSWWRLFFNRTGHQSLVHRTCLFTVQRLQT